MRYTLSFLVLLSLVFSTAAEAQKTEKEPPEYKNIRRLTEERGSTHNYDSLFARFKVADSSLTLAEYRLLYYGYFFRSEFSEDDGGAAMDSIRSIYNRDTLTAGDWRRVATYAQLAIDSAPYSLRAHKALFNAYRKLGDSQRYHLYETRRDGILDAILSTGDGRSESTAFHVSSVSHEYDILRLVGLESKGQSLTASLCDYLELEENKFGIKGLYFDVSQLFEVRERTWSGMDKMTPPGPSGLKKKEKR